MWKEQELFFKYKKLFDQRGKLTGDFPIDTFQPISFFWIINIFNRFVQAIKHVINSILISSLVRV